MSMGSHSEAIQITYDPQRVDFATLLDTFWASHSPTYPAFSRQYRSAIFVEDLEQRAIAEESMKARARSVGKTLTTAIEPATTFWTAEDYHQKYTLRRHAKVVEALRGVHGERWIDSTEASRLNGYFAGHGPRDPRRLGLSEAVAATVKASP